MPPTVQGTPLEVTIVLIGQHTVLEFVNKSIMIAKIAIDVADICFEYNIDFNDKLLKLDVERLSQYCTLHRTMLMIEQSSNFTMFVDTGPLSKHLDALPAAKYVNASYKKVARLMPHRFVTCVGCRIPKTPTVLEDLHGAIKDRVLIASSRSPTSLNQIKKFVTTNRLTNIQQKFEKSFSVAKTVLF